ncbi:protein bottleneck [Drosophila montana]|uniref:protein bottleneck n=1 Tax=Drosophila montana TaxID=40370 RepID=UPI00313E6D50
MSISTFNFQFYNYKLPAELPQLKTASSFSELEMDIDDEQQQMPTITSTPLPAAKQPPATPRYTSEMALTLNSSEVNNKSQSLQTLRPQLHRSQKRWSMELREKVLEMSKRNNGSNEEMQQRFTQQLAEDCNATFCCTQEQPAAVEVTRSVSDKINFFNKLTNTYESARNQNTNNNRFISLLRSSRPQGMATMGGSNGPVPPPKPKRLSNTPSPTPCNIAAQHQFATPTAKPPTAASNSQAQRKSSLRRKPSMEKSRATIARQNSNVTLRPQRHAMMEDLSLVVPVRLRIAEYEQRISMSA